MIVSSYPFVYAPKTFNVTQAGAGTYVQTQVFQIGWNVTVQANITDDRGQTYVNTTPTLDIWNTTDTIKVSNETMTNVKSITNGYTFEYNYTVPSKTHEDYTGDWDVMVYSINTTDGVNGYSQNSTTFSLTNIYPQWVENTNGTNSTYAGQGIEFGLNWTDNVGLSGFKLNILNGTDDTDRTCSDIFTDCRDTDTNDTLTTDCDGTEDGGNAGIDVRVNQSYLNITTVEFGAKINATCEFRCLGAPTNYLYMWYYNTSNWINIQNWTETTTDTFNKSVIIDVNSSEGEHIIRCIIGYGGGPPSGQDGSIPTECANSTYSTYYDNDDVNFTVKTWKNQTWTEMTGTGNWTNYTDSSSVAIVTDTVGETVEWKVYANDTSNNWNTSELYSFVTTSAVEGQIYNESISQGITVESSQETKPTYIVSQPQSIRVNIVTGIIGFIVQSTSQILTVGQMLLPSVITERITTGFTTVSSSVSGVAVFVASQIQSLNISSFLDITIKSTIGIIQTVTVKPAHFVYTIINQSIGQVVDISPLFKVAVTVSAQIYEGIIATGLTIKSSISTVVIYAIYQTQSLTINSVQGIVSVAVSSTSQVLSILSSIIPKQILDVQITTLTTIVNTFSSVAVYVTSQIQIVNLVSTISSAVTSTVSFIQSIDIGSSISTIVIYVVSQVQSIDLTSVLESEYISAIVERVHGIAGWIKRILLEPLDEERRIKDSFILVMVIIGLFCYRTYLQRERKKKLEKLKKLKEKREREKKPKVEEVYVRR